MSNRRVAVLRGGRGFEYQHSMESGARVTNALKENNEFVKDIVITRGGEWLHNGLTHNPHNILSDIDVVFVALHSGHGDDGEALRVINDLGIPYTGSGVFASVMALDKFLAKRMIKDLGITTPRYMKITRDGVNDLSRTIASLTELFGTQYVIKPVTANSSVGVMYVSNPSMLRTAVESVLKDHEAVLVEEYIAGKNATVAILEDFRGQSHYLFPPIEIVLDGDQKVYSMIDKSGYTNNEICPGRFSAAEKNMLQDKALAVHKNLNLSQYSRSDFIVRDGEVYFLEVNTRPSLDFNSSLDVAFNSVGVSFFEVVEKLLETAKCTR